MAFLDYIGLQRFKSLMDKTYMKIEADNFRQVKRDVQTGGAEVLYPIGTQLVDTFQKNATSTALNNPWDVVHHYANGDMALNMHFAYPDGIPFDQPEAIYYAPAGGLATGQYYISIGMAYGDGWSTSKHINFTLTAAMDEGDQLVISCNQNNATDPTNGRTWNVYAKGSTVSKDTGTTSDSAEGTELGSTSTQGVGYTNGQINAPQRIVYGYNRWSQSAVRQYLNSAAAAGAWWTAQNPWDRPPSQAASVRGFLACCTEDFVDILEPVDVVTAINTVEGSTDATETTRDKIFLPSCTQMYFASAQYTEDEAWDYYKTLAQESGLSGKFAGYPTTYDVLKKYNLEAQSSAVYVWLRSADRGYARYAWYVNSGGYVYAYAAYYASRGCPACIIKKST